MSSIPATINGAKPTSRFGLGWPTRNRCANLMAQIFFPRRPEGLTSRIMTIARKTENMENSGNRVLPKASTMPINIPPNSAPWIDPTPPTTTTTNDNSNTSTLCALLAPSICAPTTPAKPAMNEPRKKDGDEYAFQVYSQSHHHLPIIHSPLALLSQSESCLAATTNRRLTPTRPQ